MGVAGAVLGGSLLGLGLAGMGSKSPSLTLASDVHSTMTPSQPETPSLTDRIRDEASDADAVKNNALMEAESNRERQQAALRKQQAREVFTSGLGATGLAETSRKSLLGG